MNGESAAIRKSLLRYWGILRQENDDKPTCAYCSHPIDAHGIDTTGCSLCGCGMDPDWHPDPPRGDE